MKPFDLLLACKGAKLITRQNKPVSQFHYFETKDESHPIAAVINGKLNSFTLNGRFSDEEKCGLDLFMAEAGE